MSNIKNFDLNLLIALDALLDEANVSRAAERLSLTQPTVSGMLNRLRYAFDDQLLVRTRHGMIPTPRAKELQEELKRVLQDVQNLIEPVEFDPGSAEFSFTISANDFMQQTVLVPALVVLKERAPRMKIAIVSPASGNELAHLSEGKVDLAITTLEFANPVLPRLFLRRDRYVGVVRKNHPIGSRKLSMRQFLSYEHVLVSPSSGSFHGATDDALQKKGISRKVAISIPNFLVMPDVLETGDYIAIVPEPLALAWGKRIRIFAPPVDIPEFETVATWHHRSDGDTAHRWLRNTLQETLHHGR